MAIWAASAVHSILLVGLLIGNMIGRSLHSPIVLSTSSPQILPAPVKPSNPVGLTARRWSFPS